MGPTKSLGGPKFCPDKYCLFDLGCGYFFHEATKTKGQPQHISSLQSPPPCFGPPAELRGPEEEGKLHEAGFLFEEPDSSVWKLKETENPMLKVRLVGEWNFVFDLAFWREFAILFMLFLTFCVFFKK